MLPPEPVLQARKETIERVKHVIKNNFGNELRVYAFGSTEYGVSTAASDLDLIVLVRKQCGLLSQKNKHKPIFVGPCAARRIYQKIYEREEATP